MNHEEYGTVDDYAHAFEALSKEGIPDNHIALLRAHFAAPHHTATWAQLASAVGYAGGQAVNLQYGKLAARVAQQLAVSEKPQGFWLFVLVGWAVERDVETGHTAYVLRRPAIEALQRLKLLPIVTAVRRRSSPEPQGATRRQSIISVFHGNDPEIHQRFQAWRKTNVDGFHMTESAPGQFTIHYTQDKRENAVGRGCTHQGTSDIEYAEDKNGCYTTARKVCSNSLVDLIAWIAEHGFTTKNCKQCDTTRCPFPTVVPQAVPLAEEITGSGRLIEGAVCRVVINAYERNAVARARCIAEYGPSCVVCRFHFGAAYGPLADGFIHVHHVKPLSEIGAEYEVDPVADLRPVCPNCHSVIHLGGESRSIEEVRQLLRPETTIDSIGALNAEAVHVAD